MGHLESGRRDSSAHTRATNKLRSHWAAEYSSRGVLSSGGRETWPFTRSNCFPTPGGPCGRLEAARHGPPPAVRGTVGIQGGRAWFTINSIDARSADSKAVAYRRMSSSRIFSRLLLCHQLTVQRLLNEM